MSDPITRPDDLRNVSFFAHLGASDMATLHMALLKRKVKAGEYLYQRNEAGDAMAILAEGALGVYIRGAASEEVEIQELGPWEVVGEMACIDPARRSASVRAKVDSVVFVLNREMVDSFRKYGPPVATSVVAYAIERVTSRLRQTDEIIQLEETRASAASAADKGRAAQRDGSAQTVAPSSTGIFGGMRSRLSAIFGSTPDPHGRSSEPASGTGRPRGQPVQIDLSVIPGMEGLTNSDLGVLAIEAPPTRYAAGTVLCREGEPGTSCYLVARGKVEVLCEINGGPRTLATLGPGTFAGQMALVDNAPRSATIRAREDVVILELSRRLFRDLLANSSPFGIRFQEQVAVAGIRQLRMADSRLTAVLGRIHANSAAGADMASGNPAAILRAALREWSIPLEELDEMQVVDTDGLPSAAELRARMSQRG
jgi:CRP-like cAMP-binding protein